MAWNAVSNLPVGWSGWTSYVDWLPAWRYGLVGESNPHCGAMPFRYAIDGGINAKKCLRGEDWAFLKSVQTACAYPEPYVWNFVRPSATTLHATLDKSNLQQSWDWLKAYEARQCWGNACGPLNSAVWWMGTPGTPDLGCAQWTSAQDCEYAVCKSYVAQPLNVSTPNPSTLDNRLRLSTMESLFADYKQLKWTVDYTVKSAIDVEDSQQHITTADHVGSMYLYQDDGSGGTEVDFYNILGISTRTNPGLPTDQLVEAGIVPVFLVRYQQWKTDNRGNTVWLADHKILLPYINPNAQDGTYDYENSQSTPQSLHYQYDIDPGGRISSQTLAETCAQMLGIGAYPAPEPLDPDVPSGTKREAQAILTLEWTYLVTNHKWLVDY